MNLSLFQIDAFTDHLFRGNPAAVCPLKQWLPDDVMQNIAAENNLSETAFFVPEGDQFAIRWFTPTCEVDLCGHATLASAFVLFELLGETRPEVHFRARKHQLKVSRQQGLIELDFPAQVPRPCELPAQLIEAIGGKPVEVLQSEDLIAVFEREEEVAALQPDFKLLAQMPVRGLLATARGSDVDFVSRGFFPAVGIDEDPVTGSAHCELTPFWAQRLGKSSLRARQISRRGGELLCTLSGDRVLLAGRAVKYLEGTISIDLPGIPPVVLR